MGERARDVRIRWRRVGFLFRSPRAYLTHSLIWTGLPCGPGRLRDWRAQRLYGVRQLGWRLYRKGWGRV